MNALSVKNLYKRYPNGTEALKGVSFSVEPGEFVVLLGPNGSGKSTLLRTIVALGKATKGSILLDDTEITTAENTSLRKIRKRAGFIFQKFNLIKNLSVFHNVLIGAMGKTTAQSTGGPPPRQTMNACVFWNAWNGSICHI